MTIKREKVRKKRYENKENTNKKGYICDVYDVHS